MRRLVWLLLAGALGASCGGDETYAPPVWDAPDASTSLPPPSPPDTGQPAPTPKRTVMLKNPFGNVAAKGNLLWDGDFEWSTAFAQQAGWVNAWTLVTYSAFSQVRPDPACKSGMKCGYLTQNQRIAAIGVAPGEKTKLSASIWVKPPGPSCAEVGAALISCDYQTDPEVELVDADGLPDASGWCQLTAVSEPRERATCLLVESLFDEGEALIDDAVMLPAPDSATPSGQSRAGTERHAEARALIRERLRPMPPQPNRAGQAYAAWLGRAR